MSDTSELNDGLGSAVIVWVCSGVLVLVWKIDTEDDGDITGL